MEKKLKESRKKDEEDDESGPEARDQKEKEEGSIGTDIVTTVLGEMSLSESKKDEKQDKDVISSQDSNPPSDESYQSRSPNESFRERKSEESVSILPPHYFPHSNLMSSRIVTDSSSQKKRDNDEWDKKDQESSFHSGALPVTGQQDPVNLYDEKGEKSEQKTDLDGQSFETIDRSSDTNLNEMEHEVNSKQMVSTKLACGNYCNNFIIHIFA